MVQVKRPKQQKKPVGRSVGLSVCLSVGLINLLGSAICTITVNDGARRKILGCLPTIWLG